VKTYEILDKGTGETIGLFYANYYAAPGAKHGGAWMNAIRHRGIHNGHDEIPIVTNDCNYPKPVDGKPVLLSLDQVTTIYHEFGHGMHALRAKGKYPSLNGTNVKWDWVELPSQLQENWVRQKEVLDTFARHAETGNPLPQDLLQKLEDMRNFDSGPAGLRQTMLGMLDMKWYTTDPKEITSVENLEDSIFDIASLMPRGAGTFSGRFDHLFGGGYDAGYYSYKWAEVLEADIFERFMEKGLYDKETIRSVLENIYEAGGKTDPAELFRKVMGRDPNPEAMFRREGILTASVKKPPSTAANSAPNPQL
ncbi:MAG TPA: M3 family metallopeptidase, partial [Micavibrio sp.]|jgi:peptidyl-dipeptidase Dcp